MSSMFGLDESNRLVHVGEVERGLACLCRCVACDEPLIARQGEVREHHFAHASNTEACASDHESLLHRFAKQCIVEAGGLVVPMNPAVAAVLGSQYTGSLEILLSCQRIDEEVSIGNIRPDLLVATVDGVGVAVEIAYSSFCDVFKREEFKSLALPVVEIDLRAFAPDNFDPKLVRSAVVESVSAKTWLWPTDGPEVPTVLAPAPAKPHLPEELIDISGRWISVKRLPSGDITVKAVRFDPDLVSVVKSVAKANYGKYQPQYKTWIIPRWRAPIAREALRQQSRDVRIAVQRAQ